MKKATDVSKNVRPARMPKLDKLFESKYYFAFYAIAIAVLTIILFREFVFSNLMLFGSDTLLAGVFFRDFFVEYFKAHGSVPQWNPYIFGGMPFVDAFHGDIFYPISFVFKMIFPLFRALGWVLVFHVFLAGISMFMCARAFKFGNLASSIAGISYMFAPYIVSLVAPGHDGKIFVTALFPFAMMFLERGMERKSYLDFIGLGTVIGLIILTPHPQMAYFSLWAIGSYFIFKLVVRYRKEKSARSAGILTAFFVLAILTGLALSAIQFYPGYKYVKEYSPRAGEGRGGYEWATSWSMHTEEAVGMLIPLFAGTDSAEGRLYWGRNLFKDNTEYVGIFPILLGVLGLIFYRDTRKWYFLGLGIMSLIYALGATTPLFYLFYYLLPNVKSMRAPSMIMFLFSFSFALLSAAGVQYILSGFLSDKPDRRRRLLKILMIIAIAYIASALLWTIASTGMLDLYRSIFYSDIAQAKLTTAAGNLDTIVVSLWLMAVLIGATFLIVKMIAARKLVPIAIGIVALFAVVDDWRIDSKYIHTLNSQERFAKHRSVKYLEQNFGYDRILDMTFRMFRSQDYYAYFGINQVAGYHGNQLAVYDRLMGGLEKSNLHDRYGIPRLPILNLLGARYFVYDAGYPMPDSTLQKVYDMDQITIYRNPHALPRSFIVHHYGVVTDLDSIVDIAASPRFDPRRFVLLEEEPGFTPEEPLMDRVEECEIIDYEPEYVKIVAMLKAPGFVCLSDPHYPAWKAYVDGEQTEIYRAYGALRAIGVPEGEHVIEFVYKSEQYQISKMISYATVVFIVISVVGGTVHSRMKRKKENG